MSARRGPTSSRPSSQVGIAVSETATTPISFAIR